MFSLWTLAGSPTTRTPNCKISKQVWIIYIYINDQIILYFLGRKVPNSADKVKIDGTPLTVEPFDTTRVSGFVISLSISWVLIFCTLLKENLFVLTDQLFNWLETWLKQFKPRMVGRTTWLRQFNHFNQNQIEFEFEFYWIRHNIHT